MGGKMKRVIAFLLISSFLQAAELVRYEEELARELETNPTFKELEKFKQKSTFRPERVEGEDITPWSSKPYAAFLVKNSVLYKVGDGKRVVSRFPHYVIVKTDDRNNNYSFIFNKKKELAFRTLSENLISIEDDRNLKTNPNIFTAYRLKDQLEKNEKSFSLLPEVSYALRTATNHRFIEEKLSSTVETSSSYTLRFQNFFKWVLPIEMGFILENSVSRYGLKNSTTLVEESYFYGLGIRYPFLKIYNGTLIGQLDYLKSTTHSLNSSDKEWRFKSHQYVASAHYRLEYFGGTLLAGGSFRTEDRRSADYGYALGNTDERYKSSFDLFVGHGWDIAI